MKQELNVAIAGLGVVGKGVYEILTQELDLINLRSKLKINLVAISSRSKKDFIDESKLKVYQNTLDLADDKNIDVVIELIGGAEGVALELCRKSLQNKKHFITANKAMIAQNGNELVAMAEKNNVSLCFEASVAGAIPVLKNLKEGLAANKTNEIYAILNGTCNYILTKMENDGDDFSVALKEAQKLGYAEADPTFDIEGVDIAHKIAILAAIAGNSLLKFDGMLIEGITKISINDIKFANEFGYKIKLFGIFKDLGDNKITQAVYPCLVKKDSAIANVGDSYNAIFSSNNNADINLQVGRGAGSKPTASAVVADLIDIANNRTSLGLGTSIDNLKNIEFADTNKRKGGYYLRFIVQKDFAKESGFIKDIFQDGVIKKTLIEELGEDQLIYAITTFDVIENLFLDIISNLSQFSKISDINFIRIEELN